MSLRSKARTPVGARAPTIRRRAPFPADPYAELTRAARVLTRSLRSGFDRADRSLNRRSPPSVATTGALRRSSQWVPVVG